MNIQVAIAHDYLTQRGGAERVTLSIAKAFPDAPVYTSLYEPNKTFPEFKELDVRVTPLNALGSLRRHHRAGLLAYPLAFSTMHIDADVVVCSTSGWAHGVRTNGKKIVYCHTPARWLYQWSEYARERSSVQRLALRAAMPSLRAWDIRAAASADDFIVNSTIVRNRVQEIYGRQATVLHPPHAVDASGAQDPIASITPGYFLTVSRLMPYKNVDAIVAAIELVPGARLVVVGAGPDQGRLEAMAGDRVTFLRGLSDAQLRWVYANSCGVVAASYEDFGLTPVEAADFGLPTAVLRWGGFLDTVVEGETGVFFEEPDAYLIADAIERLRATPWDTSRIRSHAERFSEGKFIEALRALVYAGFTTPSTRAVVAP